MGYPSVYLYRKELNNMAKHNMLEDINLNEFIDEYVKNSVKFIKKLQEIGYPVQFEFKDDLTYTVLKELLNLFDISVYSEDAFTTYLVINDRPSHKYTYRTLITNEFKNNLVRWLHYYGQRIYL